jgi:hypothetical protein
MAPHYYNWYAGWSMVLAGFATGTMLGLFFHREDFLGGYLSFRRRAIRLGHIALVALGILNVLFSLSALPTPASSISFLAGGISMPAVCFLTGWKPAFRYLFAIPVIFLVSAVVLVLRGGPP